MGLKQALAAMSDAELAALLRARPDLTMPPPRTFDALASTAGSAPSTYVVMARLDRFASQVLDVLCLLPDGATTRQALGLLGPPATDAHVEAAVDRLAALALAYRQGQGIVLTGSVRTLLPHPARLGRPVAELLAGRTKEDLDVIARTLGLGTGGRKAQVLARVTAALTDAERVRAIAQGLPSAAATLARRLATEGPLLSLPGAYWWSPHRRPGKDPLDWLFASGLLMPDEWRRAQMPGEVGLALRGGLVYPQTEPEPPAVSTRPLAPDVALSVARAAADAAVRAVGAMLEAWGRQPAPLLKAGGVGVREVKRVAQVADVDPATAGRLLEVAAAAGLVDTLGDWRSGYRMAPTARFDEWAAGRPAHRWLALVRAWLDMTRLPSVAGLEDDQGKPFPLFGPAADPEARPARRAVLDLLSGVPEGQVAEAAAVGPAAAWHQPALLEEAPALAAFALEEAALLGVTGAGALVPAVRLLLAGDQAGAAGAAQAMLTPAETTFTLQADLTCVAPAGLDPDVAAELGLLADVESTGAATVLRFTETSVARAFDAGRSADTLMAFLEAHAAKGVPQALAYLVGDVARRHGRVRVGAVRCYVRSEDPALIAEVVRLRRAPKLGLRAVAPTVAVASAAPDAVLDTLRAAGLLPAQEGDDGALVVARPAAHRAEARPDPTPAGRGRSSAGDVEAVVRRLRQGPDLSPPKEAGAVADLLALIEARRLHGRRAAGSRR